MMEQDRERAEQFIGRLLANPALRPFGPLERETQVMRFLEVNAARLASTLRSDAFFPGRDWAAVHLLLAATLRRATDAELESALERAVGGLDCAFAALLEEGPGAGAAGVAEAILAVGKKLLANGRARGALAGPLAAVCRRVPDRYVAEAFRRREYIHFELAKVQGLRLGEAEVVNLVKASLLLRNAVYLLAAGPLGGAEVSETVQRDFAERAFRALAERAKALPRELLRSALYSNVSFQELPRLAMTSRLAAVFALRAADERPAATIDRGADTPDRSWFSIARRNYRFYGFDVRMLEELHRVAGERGW